MVRESSVSSTVTGEPGVVVEAAIMERYIALLGKYRPADVYNFIKSNEGYRLEQTLTVSLIACRRFE